MATSMASFRRIYTITSPIQHRLEIPNGFNKSKPGKRPTALVAYTPIGARMMRVHLVVGSIYWELRNDEVDDLMNDLDMQENENLELESRSNTDLIIRAYYTSGREKYFDAYVPPPSTHKTSHFRAVLFTDSKYSLNVNSTFRNLVHPPVESLSYKFRTYLSEYTVMGKVLPAFAGVGFSVGGPGWETFCSHHRLRPGSILVFEHSGSRNTYAFNVLISNRDGSECTHLNCMTELLNPTGYSFYRRSLSKFWKNGNLKLKMYFAEQSESTRRLFFKFDDEITLSTLAGNFPMDYQQYADPECKHVISGDWGRVLSANNFQNNKVKFQLSFNNVPSSIPVLFAIEFITEHFGYTSSEDETGEGEDFNDHFSEDSD